jgi:hypothetical protein
MADRIRLKPSQSGANALKSAARTNRPELKSMSREPSYPEDAPVSGGAAQEGGSAPAGQPDKGDTRKKSLMTGVAVGIGSAAIVAALLYANRSKRGS